MTEMKQIRKVLERLPRMTLELLCADLMASLLTWQGKLNIEDRFLKIFRLRLGEDELQELSKEVKKIKMRMW